MRTNKQLRDFVRSHEMRYLANSDEYSFSERISVKKVYKVDVEGHTQWVYFTYGICPHIIGEYDVKFNLFKTREGAEARAKELRQLRAAVKKKEAEANKKILDKAAQILHDNFYKITDKDNKLNDEYKKIYAEAEEMVKRFGYHPDESETLRRYVVKLERYIRTGSIVLDDNTTITKASILRINGYREVKLTDGTTIAHLSDAAAKLLWVIFGG